MEQQNNKPSEEELKDALKIISKYCSAINGRNCYTVCRIYQLLGDCPTGVFMSIPENWKID